MGDSPAPQAVIMEGVPADRGVPAARRGLVCRLTGVSAAQRASLRADRGSGGGTGASGARRPTYACVPSVGLAPPAGAPRSSPGPPCSGSGSWTYHQASPMTAAAPRNAAAPAIDPASSMRIPSTSVPAICATPLPGRRGICRRGATASKRRTYAASSIASRRSRSVNVRRSWSLSMAHLPDLDASSAGEPSGPMLCASSCARVRPAHLGDRMPGAGAATSAVATSAGSSHHRRPADPPTTTSTSLDWWGRPAAPPHPTSRNTRTARPNSVSSAVRVEGR
jgi:hypothetical protein